MFTRNELERYDRQMMIDGFGEEGQERLKKARLFIAGAGGLGSPVCMYLAAAGVGKMRIVDRDRVELGNLNRQILYEYEDIGKKKVDGDEETPRKLSEHIQSETIWETMAEDNVLHLVGECDLIIDAMDNFPTRYLLNKAALAKNIPFLHGAVYGFEGRATTIIPGETPCLRCLYPDAPRVQTFPVIGVTPAVIGCIQATEAIKYLVRMGDLLNGRLLIYDGLSLKFVEIGLQKDPACIDCSR